MSLLPASMTPSDSEAALGLKFLDVCQELTNKGILFTCTLTSGSTLNLSLDTRGKEKKEESITPLARRKQSPSSLKRNALRKKMFFFYRKKNLEKHADPQLVDSQIQPGDEMKKFKCNECDNEFKCNNTLKMHIIEVHSQMLTCDECDHTAKNANNMEHNKVYKHRVEQLDGNSDSNSEKLSDLDKIINDKSKHDEMLCCKCKEKNYQIFGYDNSWYRLPYRPAMKAHTHNEHQITIFEDIDIEMRGGFRNYRIR